MSESGVIKVKHYKQRPESERWNLEELDKGVGVPWEPIPGRTGIQVKSHFTIIGGGGEDVIKMVESKAIQVRRIYISNKDLEKHGVTIGCRGCEAQNRGIRGVNHNEGCRRRIESAIQDNDPERFGQVLSRLIQEEEGKDRKEGESTVKRS